MKTFGLAQWDKMSIIHAGCIATAELFAGPVARGGTYYVNATNPLPQPPFGSWSTAAREIQSAIDFGQRRLNGSGSGWALSCWNPHAKWVHTCRTRLYQQTVNVDRSFGGIQYSDLGGAIDRMGGLRGHGSSVHRSDGFQCAREPSTS